MAGTVVNVAHDLELRLTTVHYRIPGFRNFGRKLDEIIEKHAASCSKPTLPDLQDLASSLESKLQEQFERLSVSGAGGAEVAKVLRDELASLELDDNDEAQASDASPNSEEPFENDPEVLAVDFDTTIAWEEAKRRVDELIAKWPSMRERVRTAVFEKYREHYEMFWAYSDQTENDKLILPDPSVPAVVEELFRVISIHLSSDCDAIGLECDCTWDVEHALGVRIAGDKVVEVGGADCAFV